DGDNVLPRRGPVAGPLGIARQFEGAVLPDDGAGTDGHGRVVADGMENHQRTDTRLAFVSHLAADRGSLRARPATAQPGAKDREKGDRRGARKNRMQRFEHEVDSLMTTEDNDWRKVYHTATRRASAEWETHRIFISPTKSQG